MSLSKKPRIDDIQSTSLLPDLSPLIWIHGPGPGSRGSVLVILAQNGYTQEAHQIISLSRIASLIGRDSDGGLPELWDVMGRRKNKQGITRLMAICITSGSLSSQRARALIRDHNVDVRATDKFGSTALHLAVRPDRYSDPWSMNPHVNTDLIRVLIEACPDLVKMRDDYGHPLYYACKENAPFDVIKLFIDIYPEGFKDVSLNKLSPSTLVALAKEKTVKENGDAARRVAFALGKIAKSETGIQSCIDAGAPLVLTELAKEKAVKEKSVAARNVAWALRNISRSDIGRQSCIDAGVPHSCIDWASMKSSRENDLIWIHGTRPGSRGSVLVILAQNGYTQEAHKIISLSRIASLIGRDSDGGLPELWDVMGKVRGEGGVTRLMAVCITRGSLSPQRARALIRDHNVDVKATDEFGRTALHYALAYKTPINTDLIRVLIEACPDLVKMMDVNRQHPLYDACISNAPFDVIKLFIDIYPEGFKDVSLNKLSPSTLVALAKEKTVKENGDAARRVAFALGKIAKSETGVQSCIDAGAPLVLTELAKEKAVKEKSVAARNVAWALRNISRSDIGRQSCIDAGVPHSCIDWASMKSSRENDLIWIHGTRPGSRGSVLVILAQNGYTQEAHKIISLSRIASLIGRDSDGGLPELWDVMGKVRGKGGMTRLMAVCITRGSLSSQRARALIRDHNVDVKARDDKGRTALHYALALHHAVGSRIFDNYRFSNEKPSIPINTDLIRVLIEACPDLVKMMDDYGNLPLYFACKANAPFDVIKLLIDMYPEGFKDVSLHKLSPSTLVALAKEKAVKENGKAAATVAKALSNIAKSETDIETDIQSCITAGAPLVLTNLAKEMAVKENGEAAATVAKALSNIAESESGRQSCIDAGAPFALTNLAKEMAVKENGEAAGWVAYALKNIAESESGRQSCVAAGATLALTNLAKEKTVKENGLAAGNIACALGNIAESETGRQSCIAAGAPLALTELAKEKAVKENGVAAENVAFALKNIAQSGSGRHSCIATGAPFALTNLAKEKAVKENGLAARNVAFALKNIAQSESGRQSCIDAGAPFALTNLAKEKTVKENGLAAENVSAALYNIAESETGRQSCIAAGAPLALTELAKEKAVKEYSNAAKWVAAALGHIAKSDTGRQFCIAAGAPFALTDLAKEKAVKENGLAARNVAEALGNIAQSETGRQSCIAAGAPLALTELAKEKAVKENSYAAWNVANAYKIITGIELK
jgi:ankyrin repeat protein